MNAPAHVSHLSAYERERRTPLSAPRRNQEAAYAPHSAPHNPVGGAPKRFVAKGHDSQLQDAQHSKVPVEIVTMGDQAAIRGTISRRDKYTITLRLSFGTNAGMDLIIYKHAIESVLIGTATTVSEE